MAVIFYSRCQRLRIELRVHKLLVYIKNVNFILKYVQIVAPKRQSLAAAESVYNEYMGKLTKKREELKAVTDKLLALQNNLELKQKEKKVKTIPFKMKYIGICFLK